MPSSDTELTVVWSLTEKDVLRATWSLTWRSQFFAPVFSSLMALGCFAIAILWIMGFLPNDDWGCFAGGTSMGLFFSFLAWFQPFLAREAVRSSFRSSPGAGQPTNGTFSSAGFALSDALGRSEQTWAAVFKVLETRTDFLFFLSPGIAAPIIPKAVLGPEDCDRLRSILKQSIGDRAQLRTTQDR